jgi:hypothetical protein
MIPFSGRGAPGDVEAGRDLQCCSLMRPVWRDERVALWMMPFGDVDSSPCTRVEGRDVCSRLGSLEIVDELAQARELLLGVHPLLKVGEPHPVLRRLGR